MVRFVRHPLRVVLVLSFLSLLFIPDSSAQSGRWKLGGSGCYWDANDSGPNQCDPNAPPPASGRWKSDGVSCWWDGNDSGPDQCNPFAGPGRYKTDGGSCVWQANDWGPNQCTPSTAPSSPAPPPPPAPTGRWKVDGSDCWWDANDSGPNQCTPPVTSTSGGAAGRWKTTGNSCWWDANDAGPNQCTPGTGAGGATGRWKTNGDSCWWDVSDSGPNQCTPGAVAPPSSFANGRWKVAGSSCYWDANDSGPDQCAGGANGTQAAGPGRFKLTNEGFCYWADQEIGPNLCTGSTSTYYAYNTLTFTVTDYDTGQPVPNAYVQSDWRLGITNASGQTSYKVWTGYYYYNVSASGYQTKYMGTYVSADATFNIVIRRLATGRFKLGASGCYWDAIDLGAHQCSPTVGRYKTAESGCVWAPIEAGANQCSPSGSTPATTPPPPGRWKLNGTSCFWDSSDSGPNQCDGVLAGGGNAGPGRFKLNGDNFCYWDNTDIGPNLCVPTDTSTAPYTVTYRVKDSATGLPIAGAIAQSDWHIAVTNGSGNASYNAWHGYLYYSVSALGYQTSYSSTYIGSSATFDVWLTRLTTGRFKLNNLGCVWDPNDAGPNQCSPALGRYRLDATGCHWYANETGNNTCNPTWGYYQATDAGCLWNTSGTGPNQCNPAQPPGAYHLSAQGRCYFNTAAWGSNQCTPQPGRYNLSSTGCSWRPDELGFDLCSPGSGRFKVGGAGCYWDWADVGANQCSPSAGRFKMGAQGCYWAADDNGPNQCSPSAGTASIRVGSGELELNGSLIAQSGEQIPVQLVMPQGQSTGWVGLFAANSSDGAYLQSASISGSSVVTSLLAPATPGVYEIRLFLTGTNVKLATSAPIVVPSIPTGCSVSLFPLAEFILASGQSAEAHIAVNAGCTWSLSTNVPWLIPSATEGMGGTRVSYQVQENTTSSWREAFLSVNGTTLRVVQLAVDTVMATGSGCSVSIDPINVGTAGGSGSVNLEAPLSCSWHLTTNNAWLRVTPTSGVGPATLSYVVDPSSEPGRTAVIVPISQNVAQPTVPVGGGGGGVGQGNQPPPDIGGGGAGGSGPSQRPIRGDVKKKYPISLPSDMPCNKTKEQVIGALKDRFSDFGNISTTFAFLQGAYADIAFSGVVREGQTVHIDSINVPLWDYHVSVTAENVRDDGFTFRTNPGHVLYPATISFQASDSVDSNHIQFTINVVGDFAGNFLDYHLNKVMFAAGGSELEDKIWNHLLAGVRSYCTAP